MKKLTLIQLFGILFIALLSACSTPSYIGNSYAATQHVDVYLDAADVKKAYNTVGSSIYDQDLKSLESMQQRLVEMGKAKGADGVIMKVSEEVAVTQQSGTGMANTTKSKNKIYTSNSTTRDIKKNKITATFIKYN
jgi:hypothetical protein